MFDPFGEKALDVHNISLLRALPFALVTWLARMNSQTQSVLGGSDRALIQTPAELDGIRALSETPREE